MKVERQKAKPTFDPIVIILETEEEANHLWHKLNTTGDWGEYCESEGISCNEPLDYKMWEALSGVFRPTNGC